MVSTFQVTRHHDVAVDALAHLQKERPDAKMVLIGDGVTLPTIKEKVAQLKLNDAVFFAGYQPGDAFVRWLQALDIVWILGLGNDWSGRAAAQARACGVKVVAVDEGGLETNADSLVALDASEIAQASLDSSLVLGRTRTNAEIARLIERLYFVS